MHEHERWMQFASLDLKSARTLVNSDEPAIGIILYLCQQCAEKSLKAYLIYCGQPIKRTHDLEALNELCTKLDPEFQKLASHALELTPYAAGTRYPDSYPFMMDIAEAKDGIKKATEIFDFVSNKIQS